VYVTDDMIARMAARYGRPNVREFRFDVPLHEVERIKSTQKNGRNHDVTLYIRKDNQVVVIAKHFYPPGMYRAPSGGLHPGEDFESGIAREVREETGCSITLNRFLLQTAVTFSNERGSVFWRSFVFLADYRSGDFKYTDTHEIREVRLADWAEFESFGRIMRSLDIGGLHYRAALHEAVDELLSEKRS
jgi:8-oxo-dGTP pyrophosphatase MutT (NUDIX family)